MIVVTDLNPVDSPTIALALSVANEMNLKVSIITHSIGPFLLSHLSKSRPWKEFDLMNCLSYGVSDYFVPERICWDPSEANLEDICHDISVKHEPRFFLSLVSMLTKLYEAVDSGGFFNIYTIWLLQFNWYILKSSAFGKQYCTFLKVTSTKLFIYAFGEN